MAYMINMSDVYGTDTERLFGEDEPTLLQSASGELDASESTNPKSGSISWLVLVVLLVVIRVLIEYA